MTTATQPATPPPKPAKDTLRISSTDPRWRKIRRDARHAAIAGRRHHNKRAATAEGWKQVRFSRDEVIARWPRVVAHLICCSLGYATPDCAGAIVADMLDGQENWCEWIYSCYNKQPKPAVQQAIRARHHHHGYMSEYRNALVIVARQLVHGQKPEFASWF